MSSTCWHFFLHIIFFSPVHRQQIIRKLLIYWLEKKCALKKSLLYLCLPSPQRNICKQIRSRSEGSFRSSLICIYAVCCSRESLRYFLNRTPLTANYRLAGMNIWTSPLVNSGIHCLFRDRKGSSLPLLRSSGALFTKLCTIRIVVTSVLRHWQNVIYWI